MTVKATARTGLATPDVFYFGNLVGETGNDVGGDGLVVNATDAARTRAAARRAGATDGLFDHNRDGRVNVLDLAIVFARSAAP